MRHRPLPENCIAFFYIIDGVDDMRKFIAILILLCTLSSIVTMPVLAKESAHARSAVVMEVKSGRILYSKNMHEKLPMASTTKIMTTLLAVESGRLNEIVTVSKKASYVEGSSIYLKEGEKHSLEDLLYAVMLRSGNDAATAVAEFLGGSVENFATMMNAKAREIGAYDTQFKNPHGLDVEGHYTTAHDLALITAYALKNKKFAEIVSTKKKTIKGPPDVNWDRVMVNKNKMLWQFEGGDGVKTGFTKKSGRCLVSSATRNGMQLVTVVLNCGPMWEESSALLEYGFKNYAYEKLVDKENVYKIVEVRNGKEKFVPVKPAEDYYFPLKQDEKDNIRMESNVADKKNAPIYKGDNAGNLNIYVNDKLVKAVPLMYDSSIASSSPAFYLKKILREFMADQR